MKYTIQCGAEHNVLIERKTELSGDFKISVDETDFNVYIRKLSAEGRMKTLMINNHVVPVEVERRADGLPFRVWLKGIPYNIEVDRIESLRTKPTFPEAGIDGIVRSALPGQIVKVIVAVGEKVKKGQPLAILEAMKMENEVISPKDGTVVSISVESGQILAKGEVILSVE
jgi:biotin carboxyl carrier protein